MEFGPIRLRWMHLFPAIGAGLLPPLGLLWLFASYTPITTSGVLYLASCTAIMLGLLAAAWRPKASLFVALVGVAVFGATVVGRLREGSRGEVVRLITLPAESATRLLDRLIHERDLALFGARIARLTGVGLSSREAAGLNDALVAAYRSLAEAGGTSSSPCLSTYLFLQRPAAFDAVVVEPASDRPPTSAVIYLHGFTGNFTVQAWLIAQAARKLDLLTVAPSVGFIGNWWTAHGEETLRRTIALLRERGIRRIYLAGLSNGAVGVCRLAPKLRDDLAGLILISGADWRADDAGLPVLALQGADDERMPAELARDYVRQAGARGTYHEFAGDHLLLAKRAAEVQAVLETWLREQERTPANRGDWPK
jgi:pimeloyl-ACP methyl ester carboxylesterase